MIYVKTDGDSTIVHYPYSLTDMIYDNPQTSFPSTVTDEIAAQFNTFPVKATPQPIIDPIMQNIVWADPILTEGIWIQQWAVETATPEQIAQRETSAKEANKTTAMVLLTETDWTQMPDVALVNKADFTAYRAELRAIAINPPVNVSEWPEKPEEIWSV
jgi:Phage tail assembly chaperone protein